MFLIAHILHSIVSLAIVKFQIQASYCRLETQTLCPAVLGGITNAGCWRGEPGDKMVDGCITRLKGVRSYVCKRKEGVWEVYLLLAE